MKRIWAAAVCVAAIGGLASCDKADGPEPTIPSATQEPQGTGAQEAASGPEPAEAALSGPAPAPIADGAPTFAVLYPGAAVEGDPVIATGPTAPGGLVTYLTDADPETVIIFHRKQAEAAGLSSVMAMNQGEARAYGASRDGDNLQVVASPAPDGRTSVQVSWSAAG